VLLGNLTGVFGERTLGYTQNESARSTSYYVSTLYAVSKSFAKGRLTLSPSGHYLAVSFLQKISRTQ